ncbi:hypothetical protein [Paenibacillus sp. DMB20]|uniref:hypothetical protein n=1 Tax=Paenibacillus sp. DMB20 TaxID=1642570 RepID=UPI000627EE5F|nr:hypothetical protein [Paenibacillus sp. DMB20]KKO51120.1 hypothetical protein XI25_29480 [Paenibacillus sp. DMB20]
MKAHRQIRSKRVSSETGVAVTVAESYEPGRFEKCLMEMERLLKPFAPDERKSIVAALARNMVKEG